MENNKLQEIRNKYDIRENYDTSEISHEIPKSDEGIILLVGSSGSGKSTILEQNGMNNETSFCENTNIIELFSSVEEGEELLIAFGLRSIPTWFRPLSKVSNGERHRAECALRVNIGEVFIDEFTSVVDRNTAKSLSVALRKYVDLGKIKRIVIASCHRDIVEWLQPNSIYDTDSKTYQQRRVQRRPKIRGYIQSSSIQDWVYFKDHHYLDSKVANSCHFYTMYLEDNPVAFLAVIHRCGRDIRSYWGESRLVVLPEWQGLGIGYAFSESVASEYINRGLRYFSKTAHPALGEKRDVSPKWRATSTNRMKRRSYLKKDGTARKQKGYGKTESSIKRDADRICYSHEYLGLKPQDVAQID